MTHDVPPQPDAWSQCEPGTLSDVGNRIRRERRRRFIRQLTFTASLATVLLVGAWAAYGPLHSGEVGPLEFTCQDVMSKAQLYRSGDLSSEERQAFELHLAHCPECRRMFNQAETRAVSMNRDVSHQAKMAGSI